MHADSQRPFPCFSSRRLPRLLPRRFQRRFQRRLPGRSQRNCHGQALIEALVAGAALALLSALIVILGRYQTVDLAAVGAARALSFECAAIPERCATSNAHRESVRQMQTQHFGGAADSLQMSSLWRTRRGDPLLEQLTDVQVNMTKPHFGAAIGLAKNGRRSAAGSALRVVSKLAGPNKFGLDITGGLVTTQVQPELLKSRGVSDPALISTGMPLSLVARHTILTDAWNASSPYGSAPHTVHSRVEKGQRLPSLVERALKLAYTPTILFIKMMGISSLEARADDFRYQRVDVDLVPPDRIGTR